jgi:hypothetical protein
MRYHPLPRTAVPLVAIATLVVCMGIGWGSWQHPGAFWAPGDLSRSHAGMVSCMQCHQPFHGPSASRCAACHSTQYFESRSSPASSALHRNMTATQTTCSACHTEHRGPLAPITNPARVNPHGEFVFTATPADSCGACHELGRRVTDRPALKDVPLVKRLLAAGGEAHQRGRMAQCLRCHAIEKTNH